MAKLNENTLTNICLKLKMSGKAHHTYTKKEKMSKPTGQVLSFAQNTRPDPNLLFSLPITDLYTQGQFCCFRVDLIC